MRDNFPKSIVLALSKRASFICSNPKCKCLTIAPSDVDDSKSINIGKAAHITAASLGGPRYDETLTPEQRINISNGIFLCSNCADTIDKNNGIDYPKELLIEWKNQHENWVRDNLNKSIKNSIIVIDGIHETIGEEDVTGFYISKGSNAILKPGTRLKTVGQKNITGIKID